MASSRPTGHVTAASARGLGPVAQLLIAAVIFVACLAPALVNGFPMVFTDADGYLLAARTFRPQFIRAFGYSAFMAATGGLLSLWLTVVAQAALVAWLVTRAMALESPRWPLSWRAPVVLVLLAVVLLGHAPWLAAWLQPDIFTGLTLLALFLLVEHRHGISLAERALLFCVLVGCATVHLTHPPLLAGLGAVALGALAIARRRRGGGDLLPRIRRTAVLALLAAALGWGALGAGNWLTYGRFTGSLGGSVFLFARLAADGDAAAALRPECEAGAPWVACRFLDRLHLPADEFLWREWSPLREMGEAGGFQREAGEINPVLMRRVWPDWLANSARRAVLQLGGFRLGDAMDAEGPSMLAETLAHQGMQDIGRIIAGTRQADDGMRPLMPRLAAEGLAVAGLLVLAGLVVFGAARARPELWWPAFAFLIAYAGNAALIALGGEVHDRYGARIVWLAPFLAGLLVLRATTHAAREG